MKLLVLLAIVLLIIAAHQLLRIIELSRGLKKTQEWRITDSDNNMMGKGMLTFMILFFLFFFWQINRFIDRSLPPSASEHGVSIDQLWDANIYLITVVFLLRMLSYSSSLTNIAVTQNEQLTSLLIIIN